MESLNRVDFSLSCIGIVLLLLKLGIDIAIAIHRRTRCAILLGVVLWLAGVLVFQLQPPVVAEHTERSNGGDSFVVLRLSEARLNTAALLCRSLGAIGKACIIGGVAWEFFETCRSLRRKTGRGGPAIAGGE
jgi:hypothetical protein